MSRLKKNIIENNGTLVKLRPGKYVVSKEHSTKRDSFVDLKECKEAILLESLGSYNSSSRRSAYLSLLDNDLVIVWRDQFEKI